MQRAEGGEVRSGQGLRCRSMMKLGVGCVVLWYFNSGCFWMLFSVNYDFMILFLQNGKKGKKGV